ncbi:MAG: NAD(P)-dependent alcohol dehydrogenase [Myxococcota bacterium]
MKAAITPKYGPANVLQTRNVPRPSIGPNGVLVEVHASAVTAGDLRLRAADFPSFTSVFGRLLLGVLRPRNAVQGTMFAGRVIEVGSAVTRFTVGSDVFGSASKGAYAEYIAMSEGGALAKKPTNLSYEQAAAAPYGAITAMRILRDVATVRRGDEVLIVGASGGVGRFAVQLAKHLGANVTAVCGRKSFDLVRSLGADNVIDRDQHFLQGGRKWDVIFDTAGATTFSLSEPALTRNGRYTTLHISLALLFHLAATSLVRGPKAKFAIVVPKREDLEELRQLSEAGIVRPMVRELFPLDRIAEAHSLAERDRSHGMVIVTPVAHPLA